MVDGAPRRSTVVIGRTGKNVINYLEGSSLLPAAQMKKFEGIQMQETKDTEGISANDKFVAFTWGRKGTVAVLPAYDYKRLPFDFPMITCHKGGVTDVQFSPFQDRLLATAAEDGMVRVFVIDEDGVKENITEPDVELDDHARKSVTLAWHNSVDGVLASSSVDKTLKIWDVNASDATNSIDMPGTVTQMSWGPNGDVLSCMVKDTIELSLIDPRDQTSALTVATGLNARYQRSQWVNEESLMTYGYNGQNKRCWQAFDIRNISAPFKEGVFAQSQGIGNFFTYFDRTLSYFYLSGKGDQNMEFYSYDPATDALVTRVGHFAFKDTSTLLAMLPKWTVDVNVNEVGKCARIGSQKHLEHYAFRIPTKGGFQEEFFPPFMSNQPASTAEKWFAGENVAPLTMKLVPEKKAKKAGGGLLKLTNPAAAAEEKKAREGEDPAVLKKQIEELKAQLAEKSSTQTASPAEDMTTKPVLGYWAIRGLAQPIRCMLKYCGVEFEDKMYDVTGSAEEGWDRSAWTSVKETLGFEYPNLPYMEDGQTKITETVAIMKYIAKKWNPALLGTTAAEMARAEMLFAQVYDIKGKTTGPAYMGEKEGDELKDQIADATHPVLTKLVEVTEGSKWIAGDNLTWVDFYWAEVIEYMDSILDGRFSAEFPSTREYLERFKALDAINAYVNSGDYMSSPWNNKMAKLGQE